MGVLVPLGMMDVFWELYALSFALNAVVPSIKRWYHAKVINSLGQVSQALYSNLAWVVSFCP